jgi:hypothetical protein
MVAWEWKMVVRGNLMAVAFILFLIVSVASIFIPSPYGEILMGGSFVVLIVLVFLMYRHGNKVKKYIEASKELSSNRRVVRK